MRAGPSLSAARRGATAAPTTDVEGVCLCQACLASTSICTSTRASQGATPASAAASTAPALAAPSRWTHTRERLTSRQAGWLCCHAGGPEWVCVNKKLWCQSRNPCPQLSTGAAGQRLNHCCASPPAEQFDMDKATGHRSGPGSAGAHPVIRQGPVAASQSATSSGGVGAGRGPTGPDVQPHQHPHQA
jgi:hypothetical protein